MVWLTSLVVLAAIQAPQESGSLLARFVPVPTGKNGYEDYLRAGDMAGADLWPMYEGWLSYKQSGRGTVGKSDDEAPIPPIPPGVTPDMTDLSVRRAANDRLGDAYDIIRQGNLKPSYNTRRDYRLDSDFPEFIRFKMLAKVGNNKAYVEFADGKTAQATKDLLEGLKFSKGIFGSTLVSSLVSIATQSIFLAEFQLHLGQLSLTDAQLIDKTCQGLLGVRPDVSEVFKRELEITVNSLDQVIDKPSLALNEDQEKAYGDALKALGTADRLQLKQFVAQALGDRYAELETRLNGPESGWLRGGAGGDPATAADDKTVSNLALVLANAFQGKDLQKRITEAMAKARIQLMLLRLHAKVIEYHWQNRKWPTNIEEFADAKSAIDPFSGESFHYELKEGSYRLYSTGIPGLGPIELKYRPLPRPENSGRPLPPS